MMLRRAGVVIAGLLVLSGCSGASETDAVAVAPDSATARDSAAGAGPAPPAAGASPITIEISPKSGAKKVDPDSNVQVSATGGPLTEVRVTDGAGEELGGQFAADRASWNATVPVQVDTNYLVQAWGQGPDGAQVREESRFSTRDVERSDTLQIASVEPEKGATVGVGHPLIVAFNQPVVDRKTVQDALQVTTEPAVEGAWYWIDDSYVHYRPQEFWPAGTKVSLRAAIADIDAGDGVIGGKDKSSSFTVARSQVLQVDVEQHTMTVVRDGAPIKTYQVSTGKKGWETRGGTKIIMGKTRDKKWTDEAIDARGDYDLRSEYAMRVTNSGEFIHDAPWNRGNIGEANTSHGCIGLAPADMTWLFENSMVGDPVVVTGSPEEPAELYNRIADWNVPWPKWKAGNT